jgi:hypothetical protein
MLLKPHKLGKNQKNRTYVNGFILMYVIFSYKNANYGKIFTALPEKNDYFVINSGLNTIKIGKRKNYVNASC